MGDSDQRPVTLPQDAMILEERSVNCANGNQTGFYPSKSYTYTKTFFVRNHWKWDDAIDSWTFPGYEGKPAKLKVLSCGDEVELFLNGTSLGRKKDICFNRGTHPTDWIRKCKPNK